MAVTLLAALSLLAAADAPASRPAAPKPDKPVCREEPIPGTHIIRKTCRTQAQWDEIERQAQDFTRKTRDASSVQASKGFSQ